MAQIFSRTSNLLSRLTLLMIPFGIIALGTLGYMIPRSQYWTRVNEPIPQLVPFSHEHHVAGLGIDCRYCHTSVETSSFAGIPSTETCMTCHSQIWTQAPVLEPVRRSLAKNRPLIWNRVYDLPDFVYFSHQIHVNKGIGCSTCHGPVDRMPFTWKHRTFFMKDCLECHREPERFIRPQSEVFAMDWIPPPDQLHRGRKLVEEYHIPTARLTDCGNCHR